MAPARSATVFFAFIMSNVISECGLDVMATSRENRNNRRGHAYDDAAATSQSINRAMSQAHQASDGPSTIDNECNLDSVIHLEKIDDTTCTGVLVMDGDHVLALIPTNYWREKIRWKGPVQAQTFARQSITLNDRRMPNTNPLVVGLSLEGAANVATIPAAPGKVQPLTTGWVPIRYEGDTNIATSLWRFKVVANSFCEAPRNYDEVSFCAKAVQNVDVDAGKGAPFFIEIDGQQFLAGIQTLYMHDGYNLFGVVQSSHFQQPSK